MWLQWHSVSPTWRLDREMRRRLLLQETWFLLANSFLFPTFYLFLNWFRTRVSNDQKYLCSSRLYVCIKYTKIRGPWFQRNDIIARYQESDLHGGSFQSPPKINCMLITRPICIQCNLQHPTIAILLIKILIFFNHSVVFTCSKVINAFKWYNSWTDMFRKSSKFNLS